MTKTRHIYFVRAYGFVLRLCGTWQQAMQRVRERREHFQNCEGHGVREIAAWGAMYDQLMACRPKEA